LSRCSEARRVNSGLIFVGTYFDPKKKERVFLFKSKKIFFILSLVFAVLAGITAVTTIQRFTPSQLAVVAIADIPAFTALVPGENVILQEVPTAVLGTGYFATIEELDKKFTQMGIVAGAILTPAHVTVPIDGSAGIPLELSLQSPPSYRAFAIPFDEVGSVGGRLRKGDIVDIIAAVIITEGENEVPAARVVAQGVSILDLALNDQDAPAAVILALPLPVIEEIVLLLETGSIHLALNPYNREDVQTTGITANEYLWKHFARQ
jgi:Flp pilus assembly protein CpaB